MAPAERAPRAPRSRPRLVVVLAAVAVALVVLVGAGGYALGGILFASSRVSAADEAIAHTQRIDFAGTLIQVMGGFDISSAFDPTTYKDTVNFFVVNVKDQSSSLADESVSLGAARGRLADGSWLTKLNGDRLDAASARLGHALNAVAIGKTIAADMAQDGQFYQAYAASLVDYTAAAGASDATTALAKLQAIQGDLAKALPLATAPGLDSGIKAFMSEFQVFVGDLTRLINATIANDKAGHDAALAATNTDADTLNAFDTSGFDNSIVAFYDPLIKTYDRELKLAGR